MIQNSIFLIAVCVAVTANALQNETAIWKNCGTPDGSVTGFTIKGCTKWPCVFIKGKSAVFDLDFIPKHASKTLTVKVYGVILGIKVPFPANQPNGCKYEGVTCPLQAGKPVNVHGSIPIRKSYPSINVKVLIELEDDSKKNVACVEIKVKLQSAKYDIIDLYKPMLPQIPDKVFREEHNYGYGEFPKLRFFPY